MRVLMTIFAIIGTLLLASGISSWIKAFGNSDIVSGFFGLTFGITFTIVGGIILVVDLFLLFFYLRRKKKNQSIENT